MKRLHRSLMAFAACCSITGLCAQQPTKLPPQHDTPQHRDVPPSANEDKNAGRAREKSAGNPEDVKHPGNPPFGDTAFSSLVLDPGQLERIKRMDERYAKELTTMAPEGPSSPAYLRLRAQREQEISTILTPVQFQRWKELNHPPAAPPTPMPTAPPQGPITPMPTQPNDSLRDNMPVLRDSTSMPPEPKPKR